MKQQATSPRHDRHDRHDALLIARFYGGDVTDQEAEEARILVAECDECAALFADLGAIAAATRLLPVPPRTRDFSLTDDDAARLARQRSATGPFGRLGWTAARRSIGGLLTAAGLLGVLFAGAGSFINPTSHTVPDARFAANGATAAPANAAPTGGGQELVVTGGTAGPQAAPTAAATAAASVGSASPASVAAASAAPSAAPSAADLASATVVPPTEAGSGKNAPTNPPATSEGGTVSDTAAGGAEASPGSSGEQLAPVIGAGSTATGEGLEGGGTTASLSSGPSVDAGQLAGLGFGLVFLLGLALLSGPALLRAASRRLRR